MLRPVRTSFFGLALTFLGLLIIPSLFGAESTAWNNLKQLSFGQQVRVVLKGKKSFKGQFQSVTEDAVIIRTNGADQTLSRSSVERVFSRTPGIAGATRSSAPESERALASEPARLLIITVLGSPSSVPATRERPYLRQSLGSSAQVSAPFSPPAAGRKFIVPTRQSQAR
jgi:hypothetical protein